MGGDLVMAPDVEGPPHPLAPPGRAHREGPQPFKSQPYFWRLSGHADGMSIARHAHTRAKDTLSVIADIEPI